jgi:hypothetical protein
VKAVRRRPDPLVEAARLVAGERWESTGARLFEGRSVSVILSPRRARAGVSDVWVTVLSRSPALDSAVVTLDGAGCSRHGRLDARGQCVLRGVADGTYQVGFHRVPAGTGNDPIRDPAPTGRR